MKAGRRALEAVARMSLDLSIVAVGFVIFTSLACLSLAAFSRDIPWMNARLVFFDVAREANLWTWANVAAFLAASYAHFCAALSRWQRRMPAVAGWVLTGLVLAAMSLDDLASVHEKLDALGREMGGGSGLTHFAWIIPGMVLAIVVVLIFVNLMRRVSWRTRALLLIACATFFAGAIVLEAIGGAYLDAAGYNRTYVLIFHAEEMLEALGTVLFTAAGVSDLVRGRAPVRALLSRQSAGAARPASTMP